MRSKEPLDAWVRNSAWNPIEINTDPIVEARGNLHRFSLTHEQMMSLTANDLREFVEGYVEIKRQQLIDYHSAHAMLIYVWLDELAGSLCIGLISNSLGQSLPFSCEIDPNAKLETVIGEFMRSPYLDGIPTGELTLLEAADVNALSARKTKPLPVCVILAP